MRRSFFLLTVLMGINLALLVVNGMNLRRSTETLRRLHKIEEAETPKPPTGPCKPNQGYVDCLAGSEVGCPHGTHVYACVDGQWKLIGHNNGKPGHGDVKMPFELPIPTSAPSFTARGL